MADPPGGGIPPDGPALRTDLSAPGLCCLVGVVLNRRRGGVGRFRLVVLLVPVAIVMLGPLPVDETRNHSLQSGTAAAVEHGHVHMAQDKRRGDHAP